MRQIAITVAETNVPNMIESLKLLRDIVGEYVLDVGDHDHYPKYDAMDIVNQCLEDLEREAPAVGCA